MMMSLSFDRLVIGRYRAVALPFVSPIVERVDGVLRARLDIVALAVVSALHLGNCRERPPVQPVS